jgi:HPt (histidine-containing phosphotransfer) domain-containing protein
MRTGRLGMSKPQQRDIFQRPFRKEKKMTSITNQTVSKKIFDIDEAMERVGEDSDLLVEMIEIFLEDYPVRLAEIRAALSTQDAKTVERASHSLKGALATLGATSSREAAYTMEKLGREERLSDAGKAMIILSEELNSLAAAFNDFIGRSRLSPGI